MTILRSIFSILILLPVLYLFFYLYKQLIESVGGGFRVKSGRKSRKKGKSRRKGRKSDRWDDEYNE